MDFMNKAQFVCLSTDEKPTALPGYTDDLKYSLLLELDTLNIYYYNGEEWAKCGEAVGSNLLMDEVTLTGEKLEQGGQTAYVFMVAKNDMNAEVLAALREDIAGGANPSLVLTCPEFEKSSLEIPHTVGLRWTDNASTMIDLTDIDENEASIAIIAEDVGESVEATFTILVEGE